MAIDQEQVGVAVIVVVKESQTPAAEELRRRRNLSWFIRKGQILLIVIQAKELLLDVRNKEVLPAIAIIVSRIDSHARSRPAGGAEGHTGCKPLLFKFPAAVIDEEEVGHRIVCYKWIHSPVVIQVRRDCAE